VSEQLLDGKVAIVTGAGSPTGLGRAMALALVQAGARVALLDVSGEMLRQTIADVRQLGWDQSVLAVVADVSQPDDAKRAVQETLTEFGSLHVLVNNAGISLHHAGVKGDPEFWDVPPEAWLRVLSVNAFGPFVMAQAAVKWAELECRHTRWQHAYAHRGQPEGHAWQAGSGWHAHHRRAADVEKAGRGATGGRARGLCLSLIGWPKSTRAHPQPLIGPRW
jgi:NAD(P)-dependent dehydrogenase (short-subunit alcohol dehydrogenase family)